MDSVCMMYEIGIKRRQIEQKTLKKQLEINSIKNNKRQLKIFFLFKKDNPNLHY
jgi:hypothetical protein